VSDISGVLMSSIKVLFVVGCVFGFVVYWMMSRGYLMFFMALPGTIAHELCHLLVAFLTGSKPSNFSIIPKKVKGGWTLGSVAFVPGRFSAGFVALAPLYLMPVFAYLAYLFSSEVGEYAQIGLGYAAGLATGFMWPSGVDWKIAARYPVGTLLFFLIIGGGGYAFYIA
jgi:hypothetical protein